MERGKLKENAIASVETVENNLNEATQEMEQVLITSHYGAAARKRIHGLAITLYCEMFLLFAVVIRILAVYW